MKMNLSCFILISHDSKKIDIFRNCGLLKGWISV